MTYSSDLRVEVLERLRAIGRVATASQVANHGDKRSTGAVWAVLRDLDCDGLIVCTDEESGRFALARVWAPADEQMAMVADEY